MPADANNLIWIDMEMTGLEPDADRIIEIAVLVTNPALEMVARKALERPGMVQMMLAAFAPGRDEPGTEEVQAAGYRLVEHLDRPGSTAVDRLRVVLALRLIVTAAMTQSAPMAVVCPAVHSMPKVVRSMPISAISTHGP